MKKILIGILFGTMLSSSLLGATKGECKAYQDKYSQYIDQYKSNSDDTKKYPLLMIKSYLDSLLTECKGVVDISFYEKQKPTIKQAWDRYVPKKTRDLPQNKWK